MSDQCRRSRMRSMNRCSRCLGCVERTGSGCTAGAATAIWGARRAARARARCRSRTGQGRPGGSRSSPLRTMRVWCSSRMRSRCEWGTCSSRTHHAARRKRRRRRSRRAERGSTSTVGRRHRRRSSPDSSKAPVSPRSCAPSRSSTRRRAYSSSGSRTWRL